MRSDGGGDEHTTNGAVDSGTLGKRMVIENRENMRSVKMWKQTIGPEALFIEMTWNMKRRAREPQTSPFLDVYSHRQ